MTITFWALAALLTLGAIAFVLWPLLRAGEAEISREARRLRRQLTSLDRALADGHIDAAVHEQRRAALLESLSALVTAPESGSGRSVVSGAVLALAIPIAALLVYRTVGDPMALELLAAGPGPAAASGAGATATGDAPPPDLNAAITNLERRLENSPEDVEGWYLLGQSYLTTERFAEARDAFARAYELAPDEPLVLEMYGNAIAFSTPGGQIPDEARALFRRALALNPDSQRSLYFLGVAAVQRGEFGEAVLTWERLESMLEPGSPQAQRLAQELARARAEFGETPQVAALFPELDAGGADAAEPPEEPAPEAATGDGLTVEVTLDERLRDQVRADDVLFVFARAANGPRMPLAIQRLAAGQLPMRVQLDESMAMSPAMSLGTFPQVVVGARISKSGNATPQPGDMEAISDPIPNDFGQVIRLRIDSVL